MKNQPDAFSAQPDAAPNLTEGRLQQECVMWFNRHHRALSDLLFHIPNGGFRNKVEAGRLQAQGVKAGVPDLLLACPSVARGEQWLGSIQIKPLIHHGLFIELKTATGTLSKEQKSYAAQLQAKGYRVEVIRSLEAFQQLISGYLS